MENNEDKTVKPAPAETAKRPKKWLTPVIAVVCVAVLAAGFGGWRAYTAHELDAARTACAEAADSARVAANAYSALLDGDAATAAKVKTGDVKDANTLDVLTKAVKVTTPAYAGCTADDRDGLDAATVKLDEQADWYKAHVKSLKKAVAAVESSKLDKTVDTANELLKSSDGKVADNKTRDELAKAVKARDADAIGKATAAVNASVKAKSDADAKAKAEAEAKAKAEADAAAAAQAAQQAAQSYTPSSYSYAGGGYSGGGSSGYTGGYSSVGGSASGSSGGAAAADPNAGASDGFDWDALTINPSCASGGFCPIG